MEKALEFDLELLTLEELEILEDETGLNLLEMDATFKVKTKHIAAFMWLLLRRDDPGLTIADVKKKPIGELTAGLPPAVAGPAATARGSRRSATSTAASRRTRSGV